MEEKSVNLVEWFNSLTVGDFAGIVLLISFAILIIVMVGRTFRDKPEA